MTKQRVNVFRDAENLALLSNEPELLAIADAYASTQPDNRHRREFARVRNSGLLVLVIGALCIAGVLQPWRTEDSFAARALAVLGNGPTLHAVLSSSRPDQFVVDLSTGVRRPVHVQVEEWYDSTGHMGLHVVQKADGQTLSDLVDRGPGGIIDAQGGTGYTCSWIAAHPIEASRARVSCDQSSPAGRHGATIEPVLATFLQGYRDALANGDAKIIVRGVVNGRPVVWVDVSSATETDQVAVDAITYLPVAFRMLDRTTAEPIPPTWNIEKIETLPLQASDFRFTTSPLLSTSDETVLTSNEISSTDIRSALDGRALSLGDSFAGLPLNSVRLQTIAISDGALIHRAPGLELTYGGSGSFLIIHEIDDAADVGLGPFPPAPGTLNLVELGVASDGVLGFINHLNVTIRASRTQLVIAAARALALRRGR